MEICPVAKLFLRCGERCLVATGYYGVILEGTADKSVRS